MSCGLEKEERTRFRKRKKKKKIIEAENGLVGMKRYLFFAVFKTFLNKTTVCTNFGFQVLKPKSRDSLP